MEQYDFDAVIVGSGIAGAVIAKTLTDAGKKVLLLDAGLELGMALDGPQAFQNQMIYLHVLQSIGEGSQFPLPEVEERSVVRRARCATGRTNGS